jgi:predicted DsbA family dithiol-disulfide isomerase
MTELRAQNPGISFNVPVMPPVVDHHAEIKATQETSTHEESMTEAHDETVTPDTTPAVPKLVIEIEEHSGKTHAHVRFVDGRPEAMFFVDAPMSNEDAVVTAISAQTGLGKEEVKNALKYTGM